MVSRGWFTLVVALGCGGGGTSAHLGGDGGTDADGDAGSGSAHDALVPGTLSPEPADLASTVLCAGQLGFPERPVTFFYDLTGAIAVAIGDVNGDSNLDAVLSTGSSVQLFIGNGDGTVDDPTSVVDITNNVAPRLRDMNGDNKVDLVFGHKQTPTLYVMLNNGAGGFLAAQTLTSSLPVTDTLEAEDLNNDGKRDLIAFSYQSRAVSVILATSNGYGTATTYDAANAQIFYFALGDLTGDGRPDVITTGGSTLYVMPNNGAGVFGAQTTVSSLSSMEAVAIKDANADGLQDVLVTGLVGQTPNLAVHLNTGGGVLAAHTSYALGTVGASREIAFGDVDGDAKLDVIATHFSGYENDIVLLRGNGAGAFGTPQLLAPDGARPIAIGDFNGDGDNDLATVSASGFKLYRNTGTAPYFDQRRILNAGVGLWSARMADIDGDARLDLVGAGTGNPDLVTRRAEGSGFASTTTGYMLPIDPRVMIRSDVDNDLDLDLIVGGYSDMLTLINTGTGALVAQPVATAFPHKMIDGDFNGDGWRDVVVVSDGTPRELKLCPGSGTGAFSACQLVWSHERLNAPARGDLNKDGHLDLLASFSDDTGGKVAVFLGTGTASFGAPTIVPFVNYPPGGMFIRDFTGDANPDVLDWGARDAPVVSPGDGAGGLTAPTQVGEPPFANDAVLADMNGDGHVDVVTAGWHNVGVALGSGTGTFQPTAYYEAFSHARTVSVADVDSDGRLDVIVDHGRWASILYGRCL